MTFRDELLVIGHEVTTEFGIFSPGRGQWVGFDEKRVVFLDEPVSFKEVFNREEAGTEAFAHRILQWMRRVSETGEVINGFTLDIPSWAVAGCQVVSFETKVPETMTTGLRFRALNAKNVLFEIEGDPHEVEHWVDEYLQRYPRIKYETAVTPQRTQKRLRRVRIWRKSHDGSGLPWMYPT